jgi:hypothetical protein
MSAGQGRSPFHESVLGKMSALGVGRRIGETSQSASAAVGKANANARTKAPAYGTASVGDSRSRSCQLTTHFLRDTSLKLLMSLEHE